MKIRLHDSLWQFYTSILAYINRFSNLLFSIRGLVCRTVAFFEMGICSPFFYPALLLVYHERHNIFFAILMHFQILYRLKAEESIAGTPAPAEVHLHIFHHKADCKPYSHES